MMVDGGCMQFEVCRHRAHTTYPAHIINPFIVWPNGDCIVAVVVIIVSSDEAGFVDAVALQNTVNEISIYAQR